MQGKRGIGSIAGMVAAIAAMTLVRTFRWNELGLLDRVMIALLWIAVAAGVDCYRDNAVALFAHSVRGERANTPGRPRKEAVDLLRLLRRAPMMRRQGRGPRALEICNSQE